MPRRGQAGWPGSGGCAAASIPFGRLDGSPGARPALIPGFALVRAWFDDDVPARRAASPRLRCDAVTFGSGINDGWCGSVFLGLTRFCPRRWLRLQPKVGQDLLDHRPLGHKGPRVRQTLTVLRNACVRAHPRAWRRRTSVPRHRSSTGAACRCQRSAEHPRPDAIWPGLNHLNRALGGHLGWAGRLLKLKACSFSRPH